MTELDQNSKGTGRVPRKAIRLTPADEEITGILIYMQQLQKKKNIFDNCF